jgi:hypothetical protein
MVTAVDQVYQTGPSALFSVQWPVPCPEPDLNGQEVWGWVQHHRFQDRVGYMVGNRTAGAANEDVIPPAA